MRSSSINAYVRSASSRAWGETAFLPLGRRTHLPGPMRIYSPNMLEFLFGWTTDLPGWDGICCSCNSGGGAMTDVVSEPIGLVWKNVSQNALRKRTWAPTNLFGQATGQIPSGEFGIIYVAYTEGGRAEVADLRLSAFAQRLHDWERSAKIRIPISFLCRLYPRALGEGRPDLIESGVRYCSAVDGERKLNERGYRDRTCDRLSDSRKAGGTRCAAVRHGQPEHDREGGGQSDQ